MKGQYRYSRYIRDVIGWKLHHSGKYSPVLPAAIATAELFKYGSIKHRKFPKNLSHFVEQCLHFPISKNMNTLQWRHYRETLRCLHFLCIIDGLIILLFCIPKGAGFLRALDFTSYSFLVKSVAVSNPGQ